ncbi:SulP family inorganic anion transporter [Flammeovirga aprica]|uniref:Sulfate permease n=1 Tax=Flammeovirga aprica JL-4 TaxID=694437 RepID=A0A7X9XD56_9BACT|nr:sulfate permease [Flammeovirga aprica]NME72507.1 sulfate permease [Flammeovirga aprica JL-4]
MQRNNIIAPWLRHYKKSYLSGDLSAGLTVGIMLIPQGMAYASLAGMPAVYGLYAAMIPQFIYALFGTSRHVSVGPVAIDSMLIAATVSAIASVSSDQYINAVLLLTLMIGLFQVFFGMIRLGFLVNFMSKPVISGFTSAAAFIIGIDQLKNLLGIDMNERGTALEILWLTMKQAEFINVQSVIIGVMGVFMIHFTKKWLKKVPGSLVVVLFGLGVMYFFQLEVKVLGSIPSGLPVISIPDFEFGLILQLLPSAAIIALIAYMESISVSKALQLKHKNEYKIKNNREFIALGLSDIIGSFFGAFHSTGGFSRSAVNEQSGAVTNLANIISGLILLFTLLFLTPYFEQLPLAIIGAIILVAVYGLIDTDYPRLLWKTKREDFYMLAITFVVTLLLGIQIGILSGMVLSLLLLVKRTAMPHIAVLGKLKGCNEYRNTSRFTDVEVRDDVLIIRQDAQMYYANCNHFYEFVLQEVAKKKGSLQVVVLHFGSVSNIDSTALSVLEDLILELQQMNIKTYFSDVIGPVRDFLNRVGFIKNLGKNHFFLDVQNAIDFFDQKGNQQEIKLNFERAIQSNEFEERKI